VAAHGQKNTGIPDPAREHIIPSAIVRTVRSCNAAVDFLPGIVAMTRAVFARQYLANSADITIPRSLSVWITTRLGYSR
jgi:hypothetical protein